MNSRFLKRCAYLLLPLTILLTLSEDVFAQRVCPDPDRPCGNFKPYEMPFKVPRSAPARAEDRSAFFYAIILRTAGRCAIPESDRLSAQTLFPRNKVFVSRFECEAEDNITYTTVDNKFSILAVFGGETVNEGKSFLARVRRTGRFPDAYLRKMRVVLVHP